MHNFIVLDRIDAFVFHSIQQPIWAWVMTKCDSVPFFMHCNSPTSKCIWNLMEDRT